MITRSIRFSTNLDVELNVGESGSATRRCKAAVTGRLEPNGHGEISGTFELVPTSAEMEAAAERRRIIEDFREITEPLNRWEQSTVKSLGGNIRTAKLDRADNRHGNLLNHQAFCNYDSGAYQEFVAIFPKRNLDLNAARDFLKILGLGVQPCVFRALNRFSGAVEPDIRDRFIRVAPRLIQLNNEDYEILVDVAETGALFIRETRRTNDDIGNLIGQFHRPPDVSVEADWRGGYDAYWLWLLSTDGGARETFERGQRDLAARYGSSAAATDGFVHLPGYFSEVPHGVATYEDHRGVRK